MSKDEEMKCYYIFKKLGSSRKKKGRRSIEQAFRNKNGRVLSQDEEVKSKKNIKHQGRRSRNKTLKRKDQDVKSKV